MSILNKVFRNEKVLINIFSAILFVFWYLIWHYLLFLW